MPRSGRKPLVQVIALELGIDISEVLAKFPGVNRRFYRSLNKLVDTHRHRLDWTSLCALMDEAQRKRQKKAGTNLEWQPRDCQEASRLLGEFILPKACKMTREVLQAVKHFGRRKIIVRGELGGISSCDLLPRSEALTFISLKMDSGSVLATLSEDGNSMVIYGSSSSDAPIIIDKVNAFSSRSSLRTAPEVSFSSISWDETSLPIIDAGDDSSSELNRDIYLAASTFCVAFDVEPNTSLRKESWVRLLDCLKSSADATQQLDRNPRQAAPSPMIVDWKTYSDGIIRMLALLGQGNVNYCGLESTDSSIPHHMHDNSSELLLAVELEHDWAIVIIREGHCHRSVYAPKGRLSRRIHSQISTICKSLSSSPTMTESINHAVAGDLHLCLLVVAFSAYMSVTVRAPIDRDLWSGLFFQIALSTASSRAPLVLWVGIPAVDHIKDSINIGVPVCHSDVRIFGGEASQVLDRDSLLALQARLGESFIEERNDDEIMVHQSVLMMLLASHSCSVEVEFCNWELVADDFVSMVQKANPSRLLVFICDTGYGTEDSLETLLRATHHLEATGNYVRIYPPESELRWAKEKIGDVRTLDEIAAESQCWRPKTCFGLGECSLPRTDDSKMVVKRSHSSGAADVHIVGTRDRRNLKCIVPGLQRSDASEAYLYFHQEFVPSLQTFGEFRVMVCDGHATAILRTKFDWESPNKLMAARIAQLQDFSWFSPDEKAQQNKRDELMRFVLGVDLRLRQHKRQHFESLAVGVRYDCGITEESPRGQFFVSEMARHTAADTFPDCFPAPHHQIIEPWGRAVARLILKPFVLGRTI